MKLAEAKKLLKEINYQISYDEDVNEYRVAPKAGSANKQEAQAYYTDDLDDAVGTARYEVNRQEQIKKGNISIKDDDNNRVYWRDLKSLIQESYNDSADAQGISTKINVEEFDEKRIREEMLAFVSMQ